ncbi:MAG: hypothetical protein ABI780_07095 [Ardenticatenales bacterium]
MRLNAMKFGLAGGITVGACVALTTVAALLGVAGFPPLAAWIATYYGPWGYSVTWLGVLVGFAYAFLDGFALFGVLAWLYNRLVG